MFRRGLRALSAAGPKVATQTRPAQESVAESVAQQQAEAPPAALQNTQAEAEAGGPLQTLNPKYAYAAPRPANPFVPKYPTKEQIPYHKASYVPGPDTPTSYEFTDIEPDFSETNPYKLLQVEEDLEFEKVQTRFFELGRKYHTDLHRGDGSRFNQLWEAYETIVKERMEKEPEWDGGHHSYLQTWREPETHIFRQIFELQWIQKSAVRQAELSRRGNEHDIDTILKVQYHTMMDWKQMLKNRLSAEEQATWTYWQEYWARTWQQRKGNRQNRDAAWATNNFRRVDDNTGTDPVRIQVRIDVREDKEREAWRLWEKFFFEVAARKVRSEKDFVSASRKKGAFHLSDTSPYTFEFES